MKAFLLTLSLLASIIGRTQPPPCGSNPPAGNTCATATPICELNGYCGNTSASYTADTWGSAGFLGIGASGLLGAFCGSVENNSFLKFVASSNSISFNVWVFNSTTGQGIQIMIFSANNCSGNVTSYYCQALQPSTGSQTVSATGLVPGNTYYIMIDGFSGDVCDYIFAANSGIQIPVDLAPASSTICLGQNVSLTATGGNGTYTWDASPDLSATTGASVTATPPSTAGTYTYTVNSATGNPLCPASTTATATVIVQPCGCTVSSSNTGPYCPGETATISSTTVANGTYSWTGPNGFTSSSQNPPSFPVPSTPGSYTYTVTANSPDGTCTSSTTIVVKDAPTITPVSDITICNQASVPVTALTSTPTGASFAWTNSNASTGVAASGNGDIPLFTASNGTAGVNTSNITVTPTLNGCTGTPATFAINVIPTPTVNPISNLSQCNGVAASSIVFGSSVPGITYTWTNSNTSIGVGASGTGNIPAYTATNTGSSPATGSIIVTPSLGTCTGTPLTFTITVNPLPVVDAGLPQTVCASTPVTLAGSGASTYIWDNSVINNTPFSPVNTLTYTVTGTDANGCQNTDNVVVTTNPLPPVNAGPDQAICVGATVTVSGSGAVTYSWSNGVNDGVAFSPTSTQTYTLTGTGANNCQNTDQVVVTVNPLPNINAGADKSICFGTSLTLSATGGASYSWDNGGNNGQTLNPAIGTHTYTVTGTDANGCVNTDAITITVLALPVSNFSASVTTGFPTLTVTFTNNSSNATTYIWDLGNNATGTGSNPNGFSHNYGNIGTYNVILIAGNGVCEDSSSLKITVLPFPDPEIFVPNVFTPNGDNANDVFWIDVKYAASIEVVIFNRWGNKMYELNNLGDRWDGKINGQDASDGVYFHKYTIVDLNGKTIEGHGSVTLQR